MHQPCSPPRKVAFKPKSQAPPPSERTFAAAASDHAVVPENPFKTLAGPRRGQAAITGVSWSRKLPAGRACRTQAALKAEDVGPKGSPWKVEAARRGYKRRTIIGMMEQCNGGFREATFRQGIANLPPESKKAIKEWMELPRSSSHSDDFPKDGKAKPPADMSLALSSGRTRVMHGPCWA